MVEKCAKSGIAVVFVKEFPGTGISGATYWLSKDKAILMLSLRYKWDDHFWFTFYHEAGHILLHGKNQLIVDSDLIEDNPRENEANKFAADCFIPPKEYQAFIMQNPRINEASICKFAKRLGIAPGIIVGRLQKDSRLEYNWCNNLKRRFVLTS
jgi:HTH-type transcriptional regulator/antitoxin HigA